MTLTAGGGGATATAVTPMTIWDSLLANGATPTQAAGIMGNMISESSLNPEAAAMDSNGAYSYGLIQWNAASHPGASALVTGNPIADLQAQIAYLAHTGGFAAATGNDPGTAGSNFAHTYERCAACGYQGGSSQLSVRAANAQGVWQAAQSGNWTTIHSSSSAGTAELTSAPGGQGIGIDVPLLGHITLLSASQVRTVKAFSFMGVGGLGMVAGISVLVAAFKGKEIARLVGVPIPAVGGSGRRTGASGGQRRAAPRPDADDRRAVASERSREADAARSGKTQAQRAAEARRGRSSPGPGRTRHPERRRQNLSTDPKDRSPEETPF